MSLREKEDINLLPPLEKEERRRQQYSRQLSRVYRRLVVASLFLYVAMGAAWGLAWQKKQSLGELNSASEAQENTVREVTEVNQLVQALDQRIHDRVVWSGAVQDIVRVIPAGIKIEALRSGTGGSTLEFSGVSSSRAAVLELESRIKALPQILRVEAPLKNFALGPDGKFSLTVVYNEPEKK